jgi:predicted  nucleic acid-binding Zn-ribbon protein
MQALDSAADAARKRLADMPAAENAIASAVTAARTGVDSVKAKLQDNLHARRALEKDIAAVDVRLGRFEDHKAAVKTNQEYTALLHEIATAKGEKGAIEEKLLVLMEEADALAAEQKAAEAALVARTAEGEKAKVALAAERTALDAELARLAHERSREVREIEAPLVAKYEQLLKQRRGIALARMSGGEICEACHVRLRPHVAQMVRRNDGIVHCDSCQRILYYEPPPAGVSTPS